MIGGLLEHRYRIDRVVARGGMSTVYRGVDTRLDRPVAIKVMDPQFSADRSFVARFEREARATARLRHPGIVAVHDQGVERAPNGDHVFLVMELVEGGTLRDLLGERTRFEAPLALGVLEPVLSALAAAHQAGLVHRDVKPENVLIGQDGVVKVADFGLVRAMASANTTSDTMILGTVAYLSPEQVATGVSDARSDVYAAGVMLYEMLTGVAPYTGDNPISVAYRHVNDDMPPPSALVPEIPAELDALVVRATRRDPNQRPADAAAFLAEVGRVRESLGLALVPVPVPIPGHDDRTVRVGSVWTEPGAAGPTMPVRPLNPPAPQAVSPSGEPTGPRGTMAMPRAEFTPKPTPPVTPPARQESKKTAAQTYEAERLRDRRRFSLWVGAVVLMAVIVGVAAWWLGSGRWTAVPALIGQDEASATRLVLDASLTSVIALEASDTVPRGRVVTSDPAAGQEVLRGDKVRLVVSRGKPVVPLIQPGAEVAAAEKEIAQVGLKSALNEQEDLFDDRVPKGKVVTFKPAPGTEVKVGETVVIVLSKGAQAKPVPSVVGKTKDEAFAELSAGGFEPFESESSESAGSDRVVSTDPAAGTVLTGADRRVGVVLSTEVTVPDVEGRRLDDAKKILEDLGFEVQVRFSNRATATVFNQSISGGRRAEKGARITLTAL